MKTAEDLVFIRQGSEVGGSWEEVGLLEREKGKDVEMRIFIFIFY